MKNTNKKELILQSTDTVTNIDGELLSQENTQNVIIGNEPPYFKVYTDLIDDLSNLCKLNASEKAVFLSLAKNMSFNNTVVLLKPIKQIIMKETGVNSLNTINKAIDKLYKNKFILREARSVYVVNPNLVGKGKWEDNKALRLTIEYSEHGRDFEVKKINSNMLQIRHKYDNSRILEPTIFDAIEEAENK